MSKAAEKATKPSVSIIIPALNEAKRIGRTLDELAAYLERAGLLDAELIVVIADSRDNTVPITQDKLKQFKNARIIQTPVWGKGYQVKLGMMEAIGSYRIFMDADMATPVHHIGTALQALDSGADVAIAVRNLAVIHTGLRKYISEFGNLATRSILLLPFPDTQCGFKAFRGESADFLFARQRIMKWAFDMEILAIVRNRKYKIVSFMVTDWTDVPEGPFQKLALRDTLSTLFDIARIRFFLWTRRYS